MTQTAACLCKLYLYYIKKFPYHQRYAPGTKVTVLGQGEFEIVKSHANGDHLMKDASGQHFYSSQGAYL